MRDFIFDENLQLRWVCELGDWGGKNTGSSSFSFPPNFETVLRCLSIEVNQSGRVERVGSDCIDFRYIYIFEHIHTYIHTRL